MDKYPRQFLVTTKPVEKLNSMNYMELDKYHIYHSSRLPVYVKKDDTNSFVILFGYAYFHDESELDELDIITKLLICKSLSQIKTIIKNLAGRYVIFIKNAGFSCVFNDPCGLRSVYYLKSREHKIFATQPTLIGEATPLIGGEKIELFFHSDYYRNANEYWLPAGLSIYENVSQLLPNHFLDIEKNKQERFWPDIEIENYRIDHVMKELPTILSNSIKQVNIENSLALPLTAGYDSRLLLAASKSSVNDIYIFTMIHKKHLSKKHQDLVIPKKITNKFSLKHHLVLNDAQINLELEERYKLNNSTSRFQDALTLFSESINPLREKKVMYGNVSEIGKIHFPNIFDSPIESIESIPFFPEGWQKISFIKQFMEEWFVEAKSVQKKTGLNLISLFYWEHRLGNWASRAYNENDCIFDVFTPFNNRTAIQYLLGVDKKYRIGPDFLLYRMLIGDLWPELLNYPFNKANMEMKLKWFISRLSKKTKISFAINKLYDYLK